MLPAPLQRLFAKPGHRFALLVLLCLAVVVTPLAEVWRRQGLELRTALDARRALESVSVGVQTQRALSGHRPYAAAVLAGRSEQEPERLRRQQAVDGEVGALVATLEAHHLHRALDETDQFRNEWANLLQGIGRRQMSVAASDAAHDLLVEEVFVIMDLATGASGLQSQIGRAFHPEDLTLALQTLPRLVTALTAWADDGRAATGSADEAERRAKSARAQARRAAQAAAALLARLDAADASEPAPDPTLVRALVALQQSTLQLAASELPTAMLTGRARAAGMEATTALISCIDAGLAAAITAHQRERTIVAAAGLVALLVGIFAAALALPRGSTSPYEPAEVTKPQGEGSKTQVPDTEPGPVGAESQGPASDLLRRLRQSGADAEAHGADRPGPPTPT